MDTHRYILASASPRRRELLAGMLKEFDCVPSCIQESLVSDSSPADQVMDNALRKALEVGTRYPDATVIAADTVVVLDGIVMGKPRDMEDAARMLRLLSGRTHQVFTGVAVVQGASRITDFQVSDVTFRNLDAEEIQAYVNEMRPLDKAGAYGIQEIAETFLAELDGDFNNVMGLPTDLLAEMMDVMNMSSPAA